MINPEGRSENTLFLPIQLDNKDKNKQKVFKTNINSDRCAQFKYTLQYKMYLYNPKYKQCIVTMINSVARTLKKLRTSKGDYWTKQ